MGVWHSSLLRPCTTTPTAGRMVLLPPPHIEGLRRKEAALASMRGELEALKSTAARMIELEQELAASNTHLLAMNQEVERARMASKRIE